MFRKVCYYTRAVVKKQFLATSSMLKSRLICLSVTVIYNKKASPPQSTGSKNHILKVGISTQVPGTCNTLEDNSQKVNLGKKLEIISKMSSIVN